MNKIAHAVYKMVDHSNGISIEDAIDAVADLFSIKRSEVEKAVDNV